MAETADTPVRSSRVGSRLSKILEDLQKQQVVLHPKSTTKPLSIREIVVAVMGATGAGKSRFVKTVTSDESVIVGQGLQSETQAVRAFKFEHGGKQFSVVDTPGFNDTNRSDREILQELVDWLVELEREGKKLSGIIYLHRISTPRMEGSSARNLRMFRQLCGDDFMQNVIIGTTFWDIVSEETGAAHEEELFETEGFFKQMKDLGCDSVRISYDNERCLELFSRFAAMQPTVMRIQQELLEGKRLEETGAASAISKELSELQQQQRAEYAETKDHLQRITTKGELEKAYSLMLSRRGHDTQMEEMESQQEALRDELKRQEADCDEKLATVSRAVSQQKQGYQVQLDQLQSQLRTLRASVDS